MFKDLEGWCPDDKTVYLQDLVRSIDAQTIVEVGVYGGKSLIPMAVACRNKGSGVCYGIDPWNPDISVEGWDKDNVHRIWWSELDHNRIYKLWRNGVNSYGVQDQIVELQGTSSEFHTAFDDTTIDIFHLDGNHSELSSTRDVEQWRNKVKLGGYFVFDDVNWVETKNAIGILEQYYDLVHDGTTWRSYIRRV
jgi:predicted O-methyltransferase YrrM